MSKFRDRTYQLLPTRTSKLVTTPVPGPKMFEVFNDLGTITIVEYGAPLDETTIYEADVFDVDVYV